MPDFLSNPATAFAGTRLFAAGPLVDVALAVKAEENAFGADPVLVFDDATGAVVDLDLRGGTAEIIRRLMERSETGKPAPPSGNRQDGEPRKRGRPKLGVVAREVTLLPRHWDWLADQPGGASQALRRLVDQARKGNGDKERTDAARHAAYRVMTAIAGDFPGYEEATRALFAGDANAFFEHTESWPDDVAAYARRLAFSKPA